MATTGPVREMIKEKLQKLKNCFTELKSYKQNKLRLQYTTFFIPGWTGEDCAAWKELYPNIDKRYEEYYHPAKYWTDSIIENKENAHYIRFVDEETENSASFMELGRCLKKQLVAIAQDKPINLVGHSMGGLDIRSAIIDDEQPRLNVKNVITVGTPNRGDFKAGFLRFKFVRNIMRKKGFKPHEIEQARNMYTKSGPIKEINRPDNLIKLLERLNKFYIFMGLRDDTVMGSPKLKKDDIPKELYDEKVKIFQTTGAKHTNKDGVTQDARIFLPIIKVLCGIELVDNNNYGYIYRKG